jgi:nucleoside-diphosphate-sugar epimerase
MLQSTDRTKINAFIVASADGFIGAHRVKVLQAKGHRVIGCYRLQGATSFPKADGCFSKGKEFQKPKSGKPKDARRSWSRVEIRHLKGGTR